MAGVEVVGTVRRSVDFLDRCAVVAFPCPPSSGPKTKVLEALAYARPVVTTPSGAEGVCADASSGVFTARVDHFAGVLSKLLVDPETRSAAGKAGREKVREHHSGTAVAEAKLTAFSQMDSAAI
jgi:glycosyltransferase involved in cell wall biosynthesis